MDVICQDSDGDLLPFVLDALNEVRFVEFFSTLYHRSHFYFVELHIFASVVSHLI